MKPDAIAVKDIVMNALKEDIGSGDITSESIIDGRIQAVGEFIFKDAGVLAGLNVVETVFELVDSTLEFEALAKDGDEIEAGAVVARVKGSALSILKGERVALNFLQRISGIATMTRKMVKIVEPYGVAITDTRKTTPGLRILEKYGVRVGGGKNHRFGLYDAVLIKDNHIQIAGSIQKAVEAARRSVPHTAKIEVETENEEQVREALEAKADIIMLDNMKPDMMAKMVKLINGRALVEASGRVREDTVLEIAKCGVDLISVGALTHSVQSLDISLDISLA